MSWVLIVHEGYRRVKSTQPGRVSGLARHAQRASEGEISCSFCVNFRESLQNFCCESHRIHWPCAVSTGDVSLPHGTQDSDAVHHLPAKQVLRSLSNLHYRLERLGRTTMPLVSPLASWRLT